VLYPLLKIQRFLVFEVLPLEVQTPYIEPIARPE
jgi:hypothetical protein